MGTFLLSLFAMLLIAANGMLYTALYGPHVDTWTNTMRMVGSWGLIAAAVLVCVIVPFIIAIRWIGRRNKKKLQTKRLRLLSGVTVVWNALWVGAFFAITPIPVQEVIDDNGMWIVNFVRGTAQQQGTGWYIAEQEDQTDGSQVNTSQKSQSQTRQMRMPTFQNDEEAVEYALICAVRGRYALIFGTPEHLKPLSECLTRKGAAGMGMTLAAMEVAGGAFVGIASGLTDQMGGSEKVEQLKKEFEKRQARLENVLKRYNIPLSTPKWDTELMEKLAPRGRKFLLDMIPFWEETVARKEAREAEKGEDPKTTRERHSREVIAMAKHVVGFAKYERESSSKFEIIFPVDEEEGLPDEAIIEDGHWRINWPREKNQ